MASTARTPALARANRQLNTRDSPGARSPAEVGGFQDPAAPAQSGEEAHARLCDMASYLRDGDGDGNEKEEQQQQQQRRRRRRGR